MQYFDIKKSLPVFCSLLITACSGGGGNNNPSHSPMEKRTVTIPQAQKVAEKPALTIQTVVTSPTTPIKAPSLAPTIDTAPKQNPVPTAQITATLPAEPVKVPVLIPEVNKTLLETSTNPVKDSYNKDAVFTYELIANPDADYSDQKLILKKEISYIKLNLGINQDNKNAPSYIFNLLDDNVYYGFYRDTQDMNRIENKYTYAFKKEAENFDNLQKFNATYEGQFWFSSIDTPNVPTVARAFLTYNNGRVDGEILAKHWNEKLFQITGFDNNPRKVEIFPTVEYLPNSGTRLTKGATSPHRFQMDLHFINSTNGEKNKYLVGPGSTEQYWGVLGMEKKQ